MIGTDDRKLVEISKEENFLLGILRINKIFKPDGIYIKRTLPWGETVSFRWRKKGSSWMGRHGGGWDFALGFKSSKNSTIYFLGWFSIMFSRPRKEKKDVNDQ